MTELDANTLETLRKYFLENAVSDEKNKYAGVQVDKRGRNARARGTSTRGAGLKRQGGRRVSGRGVWRSRLPRGSGISVST